MNEKQGDAEPHADRIGGSATVAPESAADRALTERPSITIRLRIGIGIAVCFLLTAGVTIAWMVSVQEIGTSQQFLERANRYSFELEQARRFEKNFLLYGTNLQDALSNVEAAHRLLVDLRAEVREVVGARSYEEIEGNLLEYSRILMTLAAGGEGATPTQRPDRAKLEYGLRTSGARAIEDATSLTDRERLRMHSLINTTKVAAIAGLVVVLLLLAYIGNNLTREILKPLGRFVHYTRRIAAGDHSPILPARRYKDEFTAVALAMNRMIAQLKDNEAQLVRSSRMAAVGTLTAGIAHELNNPLNNISLTIEAMLDAFEDYPKDEKIKMLRDMFTQVERASATVRNLLDFTRVEKSVFVPVALSDVVGECSRLVNNEAKLSNVQIDVQLQSDLPKIRGNPRDLQQVFLNLFLNAIQAMPKGGTLTVTGGLGDPGHVRVDVTDTGVGISEEHLASIFDPFFTTKEVGVGTGLGLSVSYGIVEKHNGRLEVGSKVGSGTTFSLHFPVAQAEASPSATP